MATLQQDWLLRKLKARVGPLAVLVSPEAFPLPSRDVRPLNSWWLSVGFALLQLSPPTDTKEYVCIGVDSIVGF
jgi:hypothetical protein